MSISVTNFGEYTVKNVKSFMGREGLGFNCNLYRKNKKVAFCFDDAGGGDACINWIEGGYDGEESQLLKKHIATLPAIKSEYTDQFLTISMDWFVTDCVSKWEQNRDIRKMKRQCQTKTLFKASKYKNRQYTILNVPYSNSTKQRIQDKYDKDVEIFNDVLAKGDIPSVLYIS